ncbi:uncharacterized protein [Triticum aestivum]|uniref:uncharacterized protein isoform X1 n=1 Tax=Triticum aestivum TaxID=4565 RepID=UPI001D00DA29|nr:uncharacterized protein LOC123065883 isoform X1 [Triticum aestivum]
MAMSILGALKLAPSPPATAAQPAWLGSSSVRFHLANAGAAALVAASLLVADPALAFRSILRQTNFKGANLLGASFFDADLTACWRSNQVIFIQDGDNLDRLLQLLDPSEGKLMAKGLILSAVMSLAEIGAGRKKIVSSEHFGSLNELADSGDSDAKKVVKKIANNSRLQSMFSKIWSA